MKKIVALIAMAVASLALFAAPSPAQSAQTAQMEAAGAILTAQPTLVCDAEYGTIRMKVTNVSQTLRYVTHRITGTGTIGDPIEGKASTFGLNPGVYYTLRYQFPGQSLTGATVSIYRGTAENDANLVRRQKFSCR